jgi:hypothetical protein
MKSVYLVEVPDSQKPVFPDSCLVCRAQKQESLTTMRMSDDNGRVDFYLYKISNRDAVGSVLELPVHEKCVESLRNDFLKRFAVIFLVALSIAAIGVLGKYNIVGFIAASLIIVVLFLYLEFMNPMPMEFYHHDRMYIMLFKHEDYARDFARVNNAKVRKTQYPYFGNAGGRTGAGPS